MCGEPVLGGAKFCAECGTPLGAANPAVIAAALASTPVVSERRLVSVLFADLVGFTPLSEHRDPEEVRELLSQYFDRCRALIERYGGTVEKFIGDAVMAVWGTPVAREDDAERAVRAALALTQAVTLLGEEVGMPELRVRAGVLTGSAAVELGSEGEGMVLGDTVNTASRLQSIADPGTVLVDDVTRRASEAAIAYEDAGEHQVKGREQPVRAWTRAARGRRRRRRAALRRPRGAVRRPRTGAADRSSAPRGRAPRTRQRPGGGRRRGGSGKSRLLWEFFKYLDGIEEIRWWHQGRCLSYGEGVAYWALAEMIRARAGIIEEEDPTTRARSCATRSRSSSTTSASAAWSSRGWRICSVSRSGRRPTAPTCSAAGGCSSSGWPTPSPVILAFEDLQWADSGLLDFIDYLLEWSADSPIFVLALDARAARAPPGVGAGRARAAGAGARSRRSSTVWRPAYPRICAREIGQRAEGIPLYAVETIRMLQDRGLLVQEGARYVVRPATSSDLEVPETLQALVASRLDDLDASRALAACRTRRCSGSRSRRRPSPRSADGPESEVARTLDGLVAKQVLARDDDQRSPERGQYVFLQALLRTVAYGTLSRRARKAVTWRRPSTSASRRGRARPATSPRCWRRTISRRSGPSRRRRTSRSSRVGVRDAWRPPAGRRRRWRSGPRHSATSSRRRSSPRATCSAPGCSRRPGVRCGRAATSRPPRQRLREAIALHERSGTSLGGPAAVALASMLRHQGRAGEVRASCSTGFARRRARHRPGLRAEALAELGVRGASRARPTTPGPFIEEALTASEDEQAWAPLASVLISRAVYLVMSHRNQEGYGVLRHALSLAELHDLPNTALRARFNLAAISIEQGRLAEAVDEVAAGLALARERGDRQWERALLGQQIAPLIMLGRWTEAATLTNTLLQGDLTSTRCQAPRSCPS